MNDEPNLIISKKSQLISSAGKTVYVEIYRLENEKRWVLSIEDQFSNTSIWDNTFKSEKGALLEAQKTILKEGINNFIGPQDGKSEQEKST